jgi:hypothetical protein
LTEQARLSPARRKEQAMSEEKKPRRRRLLILSENPLDGIWTQLSAWESSTLARRLIEERASDVEHPIEEALLERKATALAYCIRNARENLVATAALSLTPRIVANYYGCLWLASALLVADPTNDVDLASLESFTKRGHGLGNIVSDDGAFPDNEYVFLREVGFFPQLLFWLGLTKEQIKDLCLPTEKRMSSYADVLTEYRDRLITVNGLFARIPELKDSYEDIAKQPSFVFRIYPASKNQGEDFADWQFDQTRNLRRTSLSPQKRTRDYTWISVGSSDETLEAHLKEHGPPLEGWELSGTEGDRSWKGRFHHPSGEPYYRFLPTYSSAMAPTSWIKPVLPGITDQFALQLILLYELSILARYRPAVWRELLEGSLDHYRTLILSYNSVVARVIPELVLRRIIGRRAIQVDRPGSWTAPL